MTLSIASYAQSSTDYKLVFDKTDVGSGAIKVRCDFTIDFNGRDSLILDFGGNLEEESVAELSIQPNRIKYLFCPDKKMICFHKNKIDRIKVRMEYVFMNLTSVLMYGNSGAEIWESLYTSSGEFYYPMNRGNIYSGRARFIFPDSLEVV